MWSFYIKSVQNGGYLDGTREPVWEEFDRFSPPEIVDHNHLRPNLLPLPREHTSPPMTTNPGAITWRLKPNGKGNFFLECLDTKFYLDGGPEHLWRNTAESNPNPDYISWKITSAGNESFFIQCVQHGGYLNADKKHIWSGTIESNPNPNSLKWILQDPATQKPITIIPSIKH